MISGDTLTCAEFVELVTDYLEDSLDPETKDRFERHVLECAGCDAYLDQIRETIQVVGRIEAERIDPVTLARLLDAFHDWKSP